METHLNPSSPLGRSTPLGLCRICIHRHTFSCQKYDLIRQFGQAMEVTRCESFEDEEYSDKTPNRS